MYTSNPISEKPLRVLVVRVGAMGDVLHGLPAVTALRRRRPGAFIGWAVDARWAPLLEGDAVDRVHPVPTLDWKRKPFSLATLRSILALRREMRAERYDLCVDLQGTIRSAVIGRMSGARRYFGPKHPREKAAAWLYGNQVQTGEQHVIRQACELMSAATGDALDPAAVQIPSNATAEAWTDERVGTEPFVLLIPTAGWGAKQWPVEHYIGLAQVLKTWGLRVLVNAARDDEPLARRIAEAAPCGRIVSSVSQLVSLTRRASLVVGGDTGPVHLAAALGRPVIALFGPTDPRRNGPEFAGARVSVLRHPESRTSHKRDSGAETGLAQIPVEQVLEAAHTLLREDVDG